MKFTSIRRLFQRSLWISISLLLLSTLFAKGQQLSDNAELSLITVEPSDDEVYTLYGHTALRVKDTTQNVDAVFNYGIFDFSKPNFIYRFSKGETDYKLEAYPFAYFLSEYEMRGSEVIEQTLNLTPEEKQKIWEALLINNEPQNKVYRYNFFFDNCATRPFMMISDGIKGEIKLEASPSTRSFRDIINHSTRNHPWVTFGCDLALGAPTDRIITPKEETFLPKYLKDAVAKASIIAADGSEKPLVENTQNLSTSVITDNNNIYGWLTPNLVCWSFFILILFYTWLEWRKKTYSPIIDCILFLAAGVGGVILWFLCFISTHPCIWPNWNIVWLQPFDLIAVILFAVKKFRNAAFYYHFINFAALTLMLAGWYFIPQHLNTAFIPLVMSIWIRSGYGIYRKIWNIE